MKIPGQGRSGYVWTAASTYVEGSQILASRLAAVLAGTLITLWASFITALLGTSTRETIQFGKILANGPSRVLRIVLGGLASGVWTAWGNAQAFAQAHPMLAPLIMTVLVLATAYLAAFIFYGGAK